MMTVDVVMNCVDYTKDCIKSSSKIFDYVCRTSTAWINDPVCDEMVRDIDKTEHIKDFVYQSPYLGAIPPERLSGGVKGLIMIYKGDNICRTFMASIFGENCVEWIRKLSFKVDFTLVLNYHMGWREMYQSNNTFNFWFDTKARPICAQTVDGKPLNTTDDVADYYSSRFWDMYGPYMEECREDIEDSARAIAEARGEVYESYR